MNDGVDDDDEQGDDDLFVDEEVGIGSFGVCACVGDWMPVSFPGGTRPLGEQNTEPTTKPTVELTLLPQERKVLQMVRARSRDKLQKHRRRNRIHHLLWNLAGMFTCAVLLVLIFATIKDQGA